jgi:hypothetical protein
LTTEPGFDPARKRYDLAQGQPAEGDNPQMNADERMTN